MPILALEPDLDRYYYDHVIGGPGAFVVAAERYETFGEAILKKLITEIAVTERQRTAQTVSLKPRLLRLGRTQPVNPHCATPVDLR